MEQMAKLQEAKILFASGQLEKSIDAFGEAEKKGCDRTDVCLSRGAALMALGRHLEASRDFTTVISTDKRHERAHYFRGIARAAMGRFEEAIEDLTISLSQNNGRGIAHLVRGLAFSELGMKDDALLDLNSAGPFSEAEVSSFRKLFGNSDLPFHTTQQLLAEENAPWNNMLSGESAAKLKRLLN